MNTHVYPNHGGRWEFPPIPEVDMIDDDDDVETGMFADRQEGGYHDERACRTVAPAEDGNNQVRYFHLTRLLDMFHS